MPLKTIITLLIIGMATSGQSITAQVPQVFIVPPQKPVTAGKQMRFNLFVHNPEDRAVTTTAYGRIMVTLATPGDLHVVEATPTTAERDFSMEIPARGYMKQEYELLLPETMSGTVKLSVEAFGLGPVLFTAQPLPLVERTEQLAFGEKESVFQPFMKNFSSYEPMYFLFGVDPGTEKSKFQLSFKYKLFNAPFDNQKVNTFVDGFHFGYTQTSYWDLNSDSKPFDDNSYKPEIFYLIPKIDLNRSWIKAFGVRTGFMHESNGKDGDDSRSTNFAYVEPTMAFSLGGDNFLAVSPRIWAYVANDNDTNQDLYKYRGYFSLQAKAGSLDGLVMDTHTRWAEEGPSFQADLTYPLTSFFKNRLNLYFHIQYFNGYAERLIQYREKEEIFRIGFSFIR